MHWAAPLAGLLLAGLLLAASGAMAQQQTTLEPSAAVNCLTPAAAERGGPEFPFVAFKEQLTGRVKVLLRFTGPALSPAITVLEQEGDDSFVDAVRAHVHKLRVPCHDSGAQPVDLVFDFVFQPNQANPTPLPQDADAAERSRQLHCVTHIGDQAMPTYPRRALEAGVQGRVIVELRFDAPDQPPAVKMLPRVGADAAAQHLHDTRVFIGPLREWAMGYRMPCQQGRPTTITQVYVYRIEGSHFGFKPGLDLPGVLPMVRNIRQQRLRFDFTQMGCPFDVALWYRQPNLPNHVRALGAHHPARQPFLDWLRHTQLDLTEKPLDAIYGDTLRLTVPCLKIDLNPQE